MQTGRYPGPGLGPPGTFPLGPPYGTHGEHMPNVIRPLRASTQGRRPEGLA